MSIADCGIGIEADLVHAGGDLDDYGITDTLFGRAMDDRMLVYGQCAAGCYTAPRGAAEKSGMPINAGKTSRQNDQEGASGGVLD